jgi:HAD superfamily hydrolase (TIGR01484 family)
MPIKIICFDLDGTLVNDSGKIHPDDIAILKTMPKGFIFIPASGRSLDSVKRIFNKNGLFFQEKFPLPLILQNGSLIYGAGEQLLGYFPFSEIIQAQLIDIAINKDEICYLFMADKYIHRLWDHPDGIVAIEKYDFMVDKFPATTNQSMYSKIMCLSLDHEALLSVAMACQNIPIEGVFSMPTIFEITPLNVNKGTGLRYYLETAGIQNSIIIAAGNDQNDLDILRLADQSFVPLGSNVASTIKNCIIVNPSQSGILSSMLNSN